MSDGRALEGAIKRAAVEYRKQGRCVLVKQNVAMSNIGGVMEYTGQAPIDFIGWRIGSSGLFVEAKSTERASLPVDEDHFGSHQVAMGNTLQDCGGDGYLVIDFEREEESYTLPWQPVREFFTAPWRKSLTLDFARAHGFLLPSSGRNSPMPWKLFFLDGQPHAEREVAIAAVAADRAKAAGVVVSLLPPEPEQRTKGPEKLTMEERAQRIARAVQDGIENQLRKAGRPRAKTRRRAG